VKRNERATGTVDGIGNQDHSITSEYEAFGPPGTGKTKTISALVPKAIETFGPNSVLAVSFSRTAAAELADRFLPLDPDQIGTLHSHCFHALSKPLIAEAHIKEWNRSNPDLTITPVKGRDRLDGEEGIEDQRDNTHRRGDSLLQELNRLRGLLVNRNLWPANVRNFEHKWSRYKRELKLLDFCDLIEICLHDFAAATGNPAVIVVDEAQDLTPMQLALIRRWGKSAQYSVLAVDDDQAIYAWAGVSPDAILDPNVPEDHKVVLRQSYRVPRTVHRLANILIHTLTRRQEKVYLPRPADGTVERLTSGTYKSPEYFILKSAMEHLERGKTIMFLASCSYMLEPIVAVLRRNAIPFHNPYRKANGYWNPLQIGRRSTVRQVLSLLVGHPDHGEHHRTWKCGDVALWADCLPTNGILRKHAKALLQPDDAKQLFPLERLGEVLEPAAHCSFLGAYERGGTALLEWWRAYVTPDVRDRTHYAAAIAAAHGPHTLVEVPQVVVGTIHSVKGGEADIVYLFPDLSRPGDANYQRIGPPRDSVIRLFYVGMTRARETVYICQRESAMAVSI
jgi:DNA helicase II / ATP-dependent DNA helicase PcrA